MNAILPPGLAVTGTELRPSADELAAFVGALFRYADEGTFISLRAFDQRDRARPPVHVEGVPVRGDLARLVERATAVAGKAANTPEPAVFAPPVATFSTARSAKTADLANGVALSVEVDAGDPQRALATLESLLGPVTYGLTSGGTWPDPNTGELHDKAHFHWRLTEPTRTPEDHDRLREARWLAAVLVGADRSAAPLAHPLRWPGSWNRKSWPRMAVGTVSNTSAEIELTDALERLREAVEAAGLGKLGDGAPKASGQAQAPLEDVADALRHIPNAELPWEEWNRLGMAVFRATGGAPEGLDAWLAWSAQATKHDPEACVDRWTHYTGSPPNKLGAGTVFFLAQAHGWQGRGRPSKQRHAASGPASPDTPGDALGDAVERVKAGAPEAAPRLRLDELLGTPAWLERDIEVPEPLLGELVTNTTRMFIGGPTGLGKTHLGFALAAGMASGRGFLHWKAARRCR
ncbi:PriCT-2 domain-containing protein, partial [Roseomonas sp. BN140053]|uniref:PriCT-2 domain-containing protein n=1 Tax=Roseomonas sp. BN140053 TaxID=3391898 RepID=UPI0039E9934B